MNGKGCVIGTAFLLVFGFEGSSQDGLVDYESFWQKTDAEFSNPEQSPLHANDLADFDTVPRYAYDPKYLVKARWEILSRQKPFEIETTTDRRPKYQKAGILHFVLDSVEIKLPVYRNLELMRDPAYKDYLFAPFTDLSNGEETYMGGRYLDLKSFEIGMDSVEVNFNLAYNPYCVYSAKYSCPKPPKENHISVNIRAGARVEN